MGAIVGVPLFFVIYFAQPFGPMNLIGSVGIAFGCAFGFAMSIYVMARNQHED